MGVDRSASGARIEIEPDALIGAGEQMASLGTQLGMLSEALGPVVSGGIASGTDPAGLEFGLKYGDQAQEFATALAEAANAFKSVGFMLEATGHNYQSADAASAVGGAGPTGGVGSPPGETKPGDAATGPNSNTVPPPFKWHLIVPFLNVIPGGMFAGAALTWPSGNSGMMRLTAAQWRNMGRGLSNFHEGVTPVKGVVTAQNIPEGGKIGEALDKLGQAVSNLSGSASVLAQSIDEFAGGVQETQDAIRRLLDRISLDGAWDMVKGIFTGEADDILREVARDVGTVLENFQRQVKGVVGLLDELASTLGDAVTALQKWVRPHLEELLGDEVGGALADAFTLYTDFQMGLTTGLINTVAGTVAMADPDTWKGMAETVVSVAKDPSKLPGVLADMGAEFIALDKWSGDHPGRAAGEAAFNIGSLFVPGGALSKTGTLAKGLSATRGLLDSGRIPGLRGLGSGPRTTVVDGVPDLVSVGAELLDAPQVRPPTIPESLLNPTSPNGVDAPSSPRGLEGPAGPPNPPGPTGTAGPSDGEPGRVDGPPHHRPESANPSTSPDSGRSPSEPSHAPANRTLNATTHSDTGTAPSPRGHAADHAPGHGSNMVESNGHSDARPPADSPAAHAPAAENHGTHDRTADTTPYAQQPHTLSDGNTAPDPGNGSAPPAGMAGAAPMAPQAPGAMHSPSAAHSPDARTPENRTSDARTPEPRTPDNPRTQQPAATGPAPGPTPSAPVNPAQEPAPGAAGEPLRTAAAQPPTADPHQDGPLYPEHADRPGKAHADQSDQADPERDADAHNDHDGDQSHDDIPDSETGGVPVTKENFDEILATEKGQRPPPENHLPPEYIAEHLSHF